MIYARNIERAFSVYPAGNGYCDANAVESVSVGTVQLIEGFRRYGRSKAAARDVAGYLQSVAPTPRGVDFVRVYFPAFFDSVAFVFRRYLNLFPQAESKVAPFLFSQRKSRQAVARLEVVVFRIVEIKELIRRADSQILDDSAVAAEFQSPPADRTGIVAHSEFQFPVPAPSCPFLFRLHACPYPEIAAPGFRRHTGQQQQHYDKKNPDVHPISFFDCSTLPAFTIIL
jgi:hypothetical protein